ncbi:MAG: hypothetical protein JWM16_2052 [Verrucomicrobiales bacterium]|nr:hypothetical protein [Verrucomicrobiales bacterium]
MQCPVQISATLHVNFSSRFAAQPSAPLLPPLQNAVATHQPFARKRSASSRVLKYNCALSLLLARYSGIPFQTCVSRRTPQHRSMSFGRLNSDVHPGLAQNHLSHGAKTLIQSNPFRPNLSQRFLRPSIRPNLTCGDIRVNSRPLAVHSGSGCSGYSVVINSSCCFVNFVVESFLSGFVAKRASCNVRKYQKIPSAPVTLNNGSRSSRPPRDENAGPWFRAGLTLPAFGRRLLGCRGLLFLLVRRSCLRLFLVRLLLHGLGGFVAHNSFD